MTLIISARTNTEQIVAQTKNAVLSFIIPHALPFSDNFTIASTTPKVRTKVNTLCYLRT
jgi:hypothetical protein